MDLTIIIVNYNTKAITANAIHSVLQSKTAFSYELLVIDNHSSDRSADWFEAQFADVQVVRNAENKGFSRANNQGIRMAEGRYILLLNSDTLVEGDTLDIMVSYMEEHPHIGAAGCRVVMENGELDKACKRGFPTPLASFYYLSGLSRLFPKSKVLNHYHMGHVDEFEEAPVDCLVGAFMMVRKEVIDEIGLLDEDYFMYGEDIDWCYRIKKAGWPIHYYPGTTITHLKGASNKGKSPRIVYEFHRSMYLFYKKNLSRHYSILTNGVVYGAIFLKYIVNYCLNSIIRLKA